MRTIFSFLTAGFLVFGCSNSINVYTTHDRSADLTFYKTFDFYEIREEHLKMKEINRRRLAMAIELELGKKGMKRTANKPDLLVNLYSLINRKEITTSSDNPGGVGYYGAATPYGTAIGISLSKPGNYTKYYTKGTVTIDLVDRKQNKLVLEAVAKIDLDEREDVNHVINYAVKKAFREIPDVGKRR